MGITFVIQAFGCSVLVNNIERRKYSTLPVMIRIKYSHRFTASKWVREVINSNREQNVFPSGARASSGHNIRDVCYPWDRALPVYAPSFHSGRRKRYHTLVSTVLWTITVHTPWGHRVTTSFPSNLVCSETRPWDNAHLVH